MREDIVQQTSGARKLTVNTMNDGQTHSLTAADGFWVASSNRSIKEQWIKLPRNYITSELPTDVKEVATKEKLRKWKCI